MDNNPAYDPPPQDTTAHDPTLQRPPADADAEGPAGSLNPADVDAQGPVGSLTPADTAAEGPVGSLTPADTDLDGAARELRVAVTVDDFEGALHLYRDVLGLPVVEAWEQEHDRRGVVLAAGRATLELLSPAQTELVDQIETGDPPPSRPATAVPPTPPVRLAIEVDDSAGAAAALVAEGAELLGGPVVTPWQHRNVRLRAPDGMQLTLFTVLDAAKPEGSQH